MQYYISKHVQDTFENAVQRATDALAAQGFGVLSDIDVKETMKNKLDADFRPYRILGACNPSFAYKALNVEDKIGTMLPCNVIVQELEAGQVEIAAVDPIASMQAVVNDELAPIAQEVRSRLNEVIAGI